MKTKEELENIISTASNEKVKALAQAELQKLELLDQASKGDDLARALLAMKDVIDSQPAGISGGVGKIDAKTIDDKVRGYLQNTKITFDDLDPELRAKLSGISKVQLTLTTPTSKGTGDKVSDLTVSRPLFQKLLSDFKARNNVYLYGGAGTGKTYIAEQLAAFLGYDYIEVNCNQFTSPLELIGGQTIDGYQKGKLEMAWTNKDKDDNPFNGAVLCLDELPKLDPNTAGVLNAALARVKNKKADYDPFIYNGRGEKCYLGNLFIIATGNTKLNETSVEYEANFKQDLSLQDRFAGSTYLVLPDYESEFNAVLKDMAFIFIYMIKVREIILDNRWTGQAFVSIRIMQSMRDSYIIEREKSMQNVNSDYAIKEVKSLKNSLDSFLSLFSELQREIIEKESDYEKFVKTIIPAKNAMPMGSLNTEEEMQQVKKLISDNNKALIKANI